MIFFIALQNKIKDMMHKDKAEVQPLSPACVCRSIRLLVCVTGSPFFIIQPAAVSPFLMQTDAVNPLTCSNSCAANLQQLAA